MIVSIRPSKPKAESLSARIELPSVDDGKAAEVLQLCLLAMTALGYTEDTIRTALVENLNEL